MGVVRLVDFNPSISASSVWSVAGLIPQMLDTSKIYL